MKNLFEDLVKSKKKTSKGLIQAKKLKGYKGNIFLGKDELSNPMILLKNTSTSQTIPSPTQLENIEILHHRKCSIEAQISKSSKTKTQSGFFTIIKLTSKEDQLKEIFFKIIETAVKGIILPSECILINKNLQALIDLFRSMNQSKIKESMGLWSELMLIDLANNTEQMIVYWHDQNNDLYDFSLNNNFIEVKSTKSNDRKHILSLEQAHNINRAASDNVIIASMLLQEDDSGLLLKDLKDRIAKKIKDPSIQLKFDGLYYMTLGNTWKEASLTGFDESHAKKNLKFFDLKDIPKIDLSQKSISGVSNIKFTSNLDASEQIAKSKYKKISQMYKIALN